MSEEKTLRNFKAGDASAFDEIYGEYSRKIYYFALGLLKDKELARDLVQEVFVSLWDKRSQVDLSLNFDNYIFTIAYNSIRKFFRRQSIGSKVIDHLVKNSPEIIEQVDGHIIYEELLVLANQTIEKLPPRRKMVYKLNKQEGMKIKEIASKMNISTRTAENHLAEALKYLKEELSWMSLPMLLFFYLFIC